MRLIEIADELADSSSSANNKNAFLNELNEKVTECPGRYETDGEMETRTNMRFLQAKRSWRRN